MILVIIGALILKVLFTDQVTTFFLSLVLQSKNEDNMSPSSHSHQSLFEEAQAEFISFLKKIHKHSECVLTSPKR